MRRRLDAELVRRGLSRSRTEAAEAVRAGRVTVGGRPASKPSTLVAPEEPVRVEGEIRRFASRGGEKLAAALERFGVDPAGLPCLDAGASTGGFTDCLLRRGAASVVAVDVGYGQLDWRLRSDPRVVVLERTNARDLSEEDLPSPPALVVADLSFVSLRTVLPPLVRVAAPEAAFVLLVKPQFEAGREAVGRGGVVRDPTDWRRSLEEVAETCRSLGLAVTGAMVSPLLGPAGNVEFFLHAEAAVPAPGAKVDLDAVVAEGRELRERSASAPTPNRAVPETR